MTVRDAVFVAPAELAEMSNVTVAAPGFVLAVK